MDTTPMDTTRATANALQRMLRQSLIATRIGPVAGSESRCDPPSADDGETRPMLYRSEAFAEDLIDPG